MKKIKSVAIGFFMIIGAMLLREITAEIGIFGYAFYQMARGELGQGETFVFVQSLVSDTRFMLAISLMAMLVWIVVFGILYKKRRYLEGKTLFEGRLRLKQLLILGLAGLSVQLFLSSALNILLKINPVSMEGYQQVIESLGMGTSLLSFLYIVLLAPIGEELVFRAFALNYLKQRLPFATANLFQALFFGLYHMNLVQGCYAFVIGLLLGWVAEKYGSVRESILLHMAVNAAGCLASAFLPQKLMESWIGLGSLFLLSAFLLVISLRTVKMEVVERKNMDMVEEE